MKKIIYTALFLVISQFITAQKGTINLGFSGTNNGTYISLDSIRIFNYSSSADTTLSSTDTVLRIEYILGINEPDESSGFRLLPTTTDERGTQVCIFVPSSGRLELKLTDIVGRLLYRTEFQVSQGTQRFIVLSASKSIQLLMVQWKGVMKSTKLIGLPYNQISKTSIEYVGFESDPARFKTSPLNIGFSYKQGDRLLFIAFRNKQASAFLGTPSSSQNYVFEFACNVPCSELPEINWMGQTYHTVQIFSQCWLKENLNVGAMIPGTSEPTDNGIIEKYCYDNNPDNCITFGGLYTYWEMRQYLGDEGCQGICPQGWHVPSDYDWAILEGLTDSQYLPDNPIWYGVDEGFRGLDAAANLKSPQGWISGAAYNTYGFSLLPGGYFYGSDSFAQINKFGHLWTSTSSWYRAFRYDYNSAGRAYYGDFGRSVRCIKD
jgi:uncharacterized protein (TIGR02145 family)